MNNNYIVDTEYFVYTMFSFVHILLSIYFAGKSDRVSVCKIQNSIMFLRHFIHYIHYTYDYDFVT